MYNFVEYQNINNTLFINCIHLAITKYSQDTTSHYYNFHHLTKHVSFIFSNQQMTTLINFKMEDKILQTNKITNLC